MAMPELTPISHSTSLETKCSGKHSPLTPAPTDPGSMGAVSELCGCSSVVPRGPGPLCVGAHSQEAVGGQDAWAEGSPETESPHSLPLGHRRLAVVTAPPRSQAPGPMDALVPPGPGQSHTARCLFLVVHPPPTPPATGMSHWGVETAN